MKKLQIGLLLLLPYAAYCADAYIGLGETTIVKICDGDYDPDTTYSWSLSSGSSKVTLTGSDNCYRTVEGVQVGGATVDVAGCGSFDIAVVEFNFISLGRNVDGAVCPSGVAPSKTNITATTINPTLPAGVGVDITVEGSGASGTASIESGSVINGEGGAVTVKGDTETSEGSGGSLYLVAKIDGNEVGRSDGFSVYALPSAWTESSVSNTGMADYTFLVRGDWSSDSDTRADLDKVTFREKLHETERGDSFTGTPATPPQPFAMGEPNTVLLDVFRVPSNTLVNYEEGHLKTDQTYEINDGRSGSGWIVIATAEIVWHLYEDESGWKLDGNRYSDYSSFGDDWTL